MQTDLFADAPRRGKFTRPAWLPPHAEFRPTTGYRWAAVDTTTGLWHDCAWWAKQYEPKVVGV